MILWWLDRVYSDWHGETVASNAGGFHHLIVRSETRLLFFLGIGLLVGLFTKSREGRAINNIIVTAIGAFAGGLGFDYLAGYTTISFYGPYGALIASLAGALVAAFAKRSFVGSGTD